MMMRERTTMHLCIDTMTKVKDMRVEAALQVVVATGTIK
jgi:hypothetical protein